MQNIMIDIETLGTRSSSVILSIGAVEFDEHNIGREFYQTIDIDSCLRAGLSVDGRTVQWWMDQEHEAQAVFRAAGAPLTEAMVALSSTYDWSNTQVWANGSSFDIPILCNAYDAIGTHEPWAYYDVRDYRTLVKQFDQEILNQIRIRPTVAHNALADAIAQARTLQAIWQHEFVAKRMRVERANVNESTRSALG